MGVFGTIKLFHNLTKFEYLQVRRNSVKITMFHTWIVGMIFNFYVGTSRLKYLSIGCS